MRFASPTPLPAHLAASLLLSFAVACGGSSPPPATPAGSTTSPIPPAPTASPDIALPSTPAGDAAAAWLRSRNDAAPEESLAFYRARYAKELLDKGSAEERRDRVQAARAQEGRLHPRKILRATDTAIEVQLVAEVTQDLGVLAIKVDPSPPHLIVSSDVDVSPPEVAPRDDREAAHLLDAYVARLCERQVFSGSIEIARNGTLLYAHACGLASRAFDVPNRLDTRFNLGSMNKMFTAVSIAQLVDAGKLAYTDTLAKAWPEYPNQAVAQKITIHQLLTHTSGLGDYFTDEYERTAKDRLRAIKDYLPLFVDKPLSFEPGSRFDYSNAGFMVLGGVVQRVSGEDYFEYVRKHVYAPAGMTGTDAYEMDHDTPNLAIGYTQDVEPGGKPIPGKFRNNLYRHVVKGGPAGGGFSTVGDLVRFADALQRGKLVSLAQVTTLTTSRGGPEPGYAYGFDAQTFRGERWFGHGGGFDGINSSLVVFPESGLVIAVMSNLDPPAAERVALYARGLLVHERGAPAPAK
jgi:CubicO group peptidase (beta-lactamase class C family)